MQQAIDRFLDELEARRNREYSLPVDTELVAEMVADDRWPVGKSVRVVMPGVRISYSESKMIMKQRGIIPERQPAFVDLENVAEEEPEFDFQDPLDIAIAREEAGIRRERRAKAAKKPYRPRRRFYIGPSLNHPIPQNKTRLVVIRKANQEAVAEISG